MSHNVAFYMSMSILLPLAAGLLRIKKIGRTYYPLILMLLLGTINEIISYNVKENAINSNIYALLEMLLFCRLFRNWGNVLQNKKLYYSIILAVLLVWCWENIYLGLIEQFTPVFIIGYSLILILIAVNQLNWLIINERNNLITNPIFIICVAIIIFYSYAIMVEVFYQYAPEKVMKHNIFEIETYLDVLYNILLAIAILCIPRKKDFILQ